MKAVNAPFTIKAPVELIELGILQAGEKEIRMALGVGNRKGLRNIY